MTAKTLAAIAAAICAGHFSVAVADPLDAKQFTQQRGWAPYNAAHIAQSPTPDVAPVLYYESDDSVPSCGIINKMPGAKGPRFTELVRAAKGEDFPQCVNVVASRSSSTPKNTYLSNIS